MKPVHAFCLALILAAGVLPVAAQSPEAPPTPAPAPSAPAAAVPAQQAQPAPAPVTAPTVYYEKLKVVVDGKAEVNGTIHLQFQALGAEPRLITVNVLAKTKDKDIAKDLWKELTLAGGSSFKVKLNARVIEIKRSSSKGPTFAVTIVGQSVAGVSVSTKR